MNKTHAKRPVSAKSRGPKEVLIPILVGVLVIAAIVAGVLILSNQSKQKREASDDGELKDYEQEGYITLGDYLNPGLTPPDEKDSDDPADAYWDDYLGTCTLTGCPDRLKDDAYEDTINEYTGFAEVTGVSYEDILNQYGMTESDVVSIADDLAKARLAALTIAFRESITVDDQTKEDTLMDLLGYDESDRESLDQLIKAYVEDSSRRPLDDVYVEVVKKWLYERASGKNS